MRVLYFSRDYGPHDHRFLSAIAEAGHEALFLRLERRGELLDLRPLPEGAREIAWETGDGPFSWERSPELLNALQGVLAVEQPDLVHAGPLHSAGALAAQSGFHPLVLMSWGSDILWEAARDADVRERIRDALSGVDAFLGDCEAVQRAAEELGMPRERSVLFPWGVDLQHFHPDEDDGGLQARLGWEGAFVLLHTRSWEALYDLETVARGFVVAAQKDSALRLLMLGSGRLEGRVRSILEEGGVLGKVHFAGQVAQDDLPHYYRAADIYLSASQSDGSSVSLMEALACGLPALVSDIPGNREWVQMGEGGWLFPVGDAEALAAGIARAKERTSTLAEMARRARQTAEARADWDANRLGIFRAYEMAMGHPRGKAL